MYVPVSVELCVLSLSDSICANFKLPQFFTQTLCTSKNVKTSYFIQK